MPHMSKQEIYVSTDEQLEAIVGSTRPDGIYAAEVRWAEQELSRRA